MTLASILILTGIVCLVAGASLPVVYAVRTRLSARRHAPQTHGRLVEAVGAASPR